MDALQTSLTMALDPCAIMRAMGMEPDPWQIQLLNTKNSTIANCHRQAGKSQSIGVKVAHVAVFEPGTLSIILSKAQRQAAETFRKVLDAIMVAWPGIKFRHLSTLYCELPNGSRIISLPGKEDTIRGYSKVRLLVIDEAARVPDDLYRAVRPMVAISLGQIMILSTPFGQRGFFYKEWINSNNYEKIKVNVDTCPRISKEFIASELASMGPQWVQQEYYNSFTSTFGVVYPDFEQTFIDDWPYPQGVLVGGIDWGWRNPFAAVWGIHDPKTDILWLKNERYLRFTPLHEHRDALLPIRCLWAVDPAGKTELNEFKHAGIKVRPANNDIKAGIAAVTARITTDRLKIYRPNMPNTIDESQLYRYPEPRDFAPDPEIPIDDHNHSLGAIRYLTSLLDHRFMAKFRRKSIRDIDPALLSMSESPTHIINAESRLLGSQLWNNPDAWQSIG